MNTECSVVGFDDRVRYLKDGKLFEYLDILTLNVTNSRSVTYSNEIVTNPKKVTNLTLLLTFGDGTTENVVIILSGYSSRIFEINKVPIPDPVPPPNE